MSICTRFKAVRKTIGLSQAEFGKKIGVSRDVIANIEGSRIEPKDIHILAICKEFNINEKWLRSGEGEMNQKRSEYDDIIERLRKIHIQSESGSEEAQYKERLASAILNISDEGAAAIIELLKDMGYIKKED